MLTLSVLPLSASQIDSQTGLPLETVWPAWTAAPIDHYLWPENDYRPRAWARLGYDDQALYLRLAVEEDEPRITYYNHQDPVYLDSCLEFFVEPHPEESTLFFNFEFNAAGALLSAYGLNRDERTSLTPAELDSLIIQAGRRSEPRPVWQITCRIPRSLLESHSGPLDWRPGLAMGANFYKCGDQTPQPHYGCWNLITSAEADFHRPQDFGRIILA
ncbi:MAG: carbohydrate-binding family 9-like protein [Clostridiaceae bacterium]|nr:carbohydrate-binding family 9-like protein [Clostridiaceae bacterium]